MQAVWPVYPQIRRKLQYDVVVFTEDGNYYAADENGRILCVNSPTACIQEAVNYVINNLTYGGKIYIRSGDYYFSPSALNTSNSAWVAIPASMKYLEIFGDGDATRLHLPQNPSTSTAWVFTIHRYASSAQAVVEPLYAIRSLAFVNDVNTGPIVAPLVLSASDEAGANFLLEDVAVYDNPSGSSSISGIGGIWLNNLYGANVRNFRYLGNNPNTNNSIVVFDSVTLGKVVDSFFYNAQYWNATAIWLGTGTILVDSTEIYGFNNAFYGNNTDNSSTIHVTNSILGTVRGGSQSPSGNSAISLNKYLLSNGGNLYVKFFVENSFIDFGTINAGNASGYIQAVIKNSWIYGDCNLATGIVNIPSSGFSAYFELSGNRISMNEYAGACGPSAIAFGYSASPSSVVVTMNIHDNIIVENSDRYIQNQGEIGVLATLGFENIDFRNNTVYLQGNTNGLLEVNGSTLGLWRIEDNVIDNSSVSTSNGFYIMGINTSSLTLPHIILRRNRFTGNPWTAVFYGSPTVTGGPVSVDLSNIFPSGSFSLPSPSVSTPSVPSSGTSVTNTYDFPVEVYLSGGTVTQVTVTKGGQTYTVYSNSSGGSLNNVVRLDPGASITINYSTAPTWVWVPTIH